MGHRQYKNGISIAIISIVIIFTLGCGDIKKSPDRVYKFAKFENEALIEEIRAFNSDKRKEGTPNLLYTIVSQLPSDDGNTDTLCYQLIDARLISDIVGFDKPYINDFARTDSIIVGIISTESLSPKQQISARQVRRIFRRLFPKAYKNSYYNAHKDMLIVDQPYSPEWTLKFVNDSLVYKDIYYPQIITD